jgi:hypothetical protein
MNEILTRQVLTEKSPFTLVNFYNSLGTLVVKELKEEHSTYILNLVEIPSDYYYVVKGNDFTHQASVIPKCHCKILKNHY